MSWGKWIDLGEVGVDSGRLMISDPAYSKLWTADLLNWPNVKDVNAFVKDREVLHESFKYAKGHEGLGVVFFSGFGDGIYRVRGKVVDFEKWGGRRLVEVRIIMEEEEE